MLEFLKGMRSSLRELRLLRNWVVDQEDEKLARLGGLQMSLHGVEIQNYEWEALAEDTYDCYHSRHYEQLWLNQKVFNSLQQGRKVCPYEPEHYVGGLPDDQACPGCRRGM